MTSPRNIKMRRSDELPPSFAASIGADVSGMYQLQQISKPRVTYQGLDITLSHNVIGRRRQVGRRRQAGRQGRSMYKHGGKDGGPFALGLFVRASSRFTHPPLSQRRQR